jgi:pimeloyl-ACP methyl ester carboxylesterase
MISKTLRIGLFIVIALFILLISGYRADNKVEELEPEYFTPESQYIDVMDSKLHIRKRGNGKPIFLIHGSFASLHTWDSWEAELSKTFTTISVDLPGHGLTGPNKNEIYTTDYYADLIFALADSLQLDSFYIAGNSMGGNVAWKMALKNPARIKKLILVDAAGYTKTDVNKPASQPFIFKLLNNNLIASIFFKITPRFMFSLNLKQVYGDKEKITEDQIDLYYNLMLREGNRAATLKRLRNGGKDLQDSIQYITTPTLIIWGEKDAWIPVANAYRFNSDIKSSKLIIFKEAGHVPMEEIPLETLIPAREFLLNN